MPRDDERERRVGEWKRRLSCPRFLTDVVGSRSRNHRHAERLEACSGNGKVRLVALGCRDASRPARKRGQPFTTAGSEIEEVG
ncbi:MAG: hypothetical protein H0U03_00710 [Actinobacteria bacterium]|nr:hypothetical protein [Actinomycetota bacterium]